MKNSLFFARRDSYLPHVVVAAVVLAACGEAAQPEGGRDGQTEADSKDGGSGSTAEDSGALVLPLRPLSRIAMIYVPELNEGEGGPRLEAKDSIPLAVGDGYPQTVALVAPLSPYATCGRLKGELMLRELTGGSAAFDAQLMNNLVQVTVRSEGEADLRISGEYARAADDECPFLDVAKVPVSIDLHLRAVRPAGAQVVRPSSCAQASVPRIAVSSSLGAVSVQLVDAAGEPIFVRNADSDAPSELRVRGARPAKAGSSPAVLADLVASNSGPVTLETLGTALRIEAVDAPQITSVAVDFQLGGFAGIPLSLMDGMSVKGGNRSANRIAPVITSARVGSDEVCSQLPSEWFELVSLTRETCEVVPLPDDQRYVFNGRPLAFAGRMRKDGRCALKLQSERLAGSGYEKTLAITVTDSSSLNE